MEAGAKGQVGGMEMGEAERKLLAWESRSWICEGCVSANEEIFKEEERRKNVTGRGRGNMSRRS